MNQKKFIRVSTRGTASLGSLAQYDTYEGWVDDNGRIVLDPVRIVPMKRQVDDEQR